jgi:hypothetical protein
MTANGLEYLLLLSMAPLPHVVDKPRNWSAAGMASLEPRLEPAAEKSRGQVMLA